jgi:hypothetical protein
MTSMRGAVVLAAGALLVAGCGGGGHSKADGSIAIVQYDAAAGGDVGAAGGDVGAAGSDGSAPEAAADAQEDAKPDQATDFGPPQGDGSCPVGTGKLAPAPAELVIDDFDDGGGGKGGGQLNGRKRHTPAFAVTEQFDATAAATFSPVPGVDLNCGASPPGAAHIKGSAADTGATFALIFSVERDGGKAIDHYDASGTRGVSFRAALGDASATKMLTVQVNLASSQWDYAKDVTIAGTAWQTVTVLWSDLEAAPGADAFSAAALNQIVFPFFAGVDVDLFIDDIAFVK